MKTMSCTKPIGDLKAIHRLIGSTGSETDALTARILYNRNVKHMHGYIAKNPQADVDELSEEAARIFRYRNKGDKLSKYQRNAIADLVGESLDTFAQKKEEQQ